ncbi:MAG: lysophospholipid acyltransferase family protein [Cyclobacteriaceae bacterium]|nr:lysophospholipid acyltransferase family protein [Cyclobacteriaceae bacterium]
MIILNFLLYYLVIIPISLLPFPVLYKISDLLYYLFYYIIGYRKKVVLQNIQQSFPEKTSAEHIAICKKFYRHFCDLILESLKVFTISEKEVRQRMVFKNPEFLNAYFHQNRSIILAGGHYNNWELFAVAVDAPMLHKAIAIYKPLSNPFFDAKMRATRGKYGLRMISTKVVGQVFEEEKKNLTATIFGIDQSPSHLAKSYWMNFLHQDTAVLFGTEKYAKEYNYPVVFGHINKVKRGHYSFEFFSVCDEPQKTSYGEITASITHLLEKDIIQQPEFWLWSHKRWKHKRPCTLDTPALVQ